MMESKLKTGNMFLDEEKAQPGDLLKFRIPFVGIALIRIAGRGEGWFSGLRREGR